ncbi:UvrD-like helicase, ATP-binding domain, P-loop containing nucleoside triphosphate hydrolase [Tanacetum coccineum]
MGSRLKKQVLNLLLKLSSGWRPKNRSTDFCCKSSSQILKQFKVEGFYVICTNDIIKEVKYVQVLKVCDVLALDEIPKLTKRLESIFSAYTYAYISRCTEKCFEGTLEVSKTWPASEEIIRFRYLSECENESKGSVNPGDARIFVENSKVSESLLLMKFYSFSRGVVSQVKDEQMDIILSPKSSFIIGRSGTGKTTILTMKLFQCEQKFRIASDGIYEGENNRFRGDKVRKELLLFPCSLFSFLYCIVLTSRVDVIDSVSSVVNSSVEINHNDTNVIISEVNDIPDTFTNIPVSNYPLVITFQKFLMMLDGTLSNSFFERFLEAREGYHGNRISSRSVAFQTFIRLREVTFDRFCSFYWPHFNSTQTKKLDPSRVFTEIISHIKGGLQAGECSDGKLGYDRYCLLAESRSSTLTREKREIVYTIYETYEKMKTERGEFDLGDLVNDIHHRLENGNYEGDKMDLVYIDEVQDLSMRQISLFKYICHNVDEGFIFAGDTAQTIARGIDFRFQDIRSLFYKEFLSTKTSGKKDKGLVSEIFQLKQNFRTHAAVLDLAQSVIDIIYHYFIHSIDKLEPEISLISGEAPVLLESGSDENAMVTIFGDTGTSGKIAGFGADQVILVRDDGAKTEICEYVGKNALVLTILECKGLEFHDVLLYNFFGTSPLKDQWRILYGYMKKHNLLNEKLPQSFPTFSEARHSVLCSELKQLYVAITRTRQRLWICENKEELSKPMFDYWKMKGLVQVRELDDSVAQAMRVASTPQEWLDRGKKFFYENNFVMSTLCFEKAGDTMWEKLAKASGLRESAYQMRGTNHEAFVSYVREAAGIFESIGKLESAASCYCDLEDYERAGKLYLHTCGKIDEAAECFTLSGCYSEAAEAYAKGDQFSNCLSICTKGKLFDKGLEYIKYWKEHVNIRCKEIRQIEEFLEKCALYYHEHKDSRTMMKFVRAFCSLESKRVFLRSLGCLDDLLLLEEELGHFLEAAELARSWGDILMEADLLEKAGHFKDATVLLLWYVFFSSLWGNGNRGWPLKRFVEKEELCNRVKALAKMDSDIFYSFVCNELNVLSDQRSSLTELKNDLDVSQENKSLRGKLLSIRKILDVHFHLSSSKYEWGDELPIDISKHCEDKVHQNWVSVKTLIFYWNLWKENVVNIFESLGIFHNEEPNKHEGHVDFSLIYFGVRKQCVNGNTVYLLVNKDADWIKNYSQKGVHRDGKLLTIDIPDLMFAIQSYWQSELLSVGIKVLETLERLLHMSKSNGSAFHQSTSLLHIFEVTKFLLDCQHLNVTSSKKKLQSFLKISTSYFDLVFPLDWRNSISEDLISLRKTDLSVNLLNEIILQYIDIKGDLTDSKIGRVMMICFSCRQPLVLFEMVMSKIQNAPSWKSFLVKFWNDGQKDMCVSRELKNVLEDTFKPNCKCPGHISPHSFMYLLDHLLFFASLSSEIIFTTRSSLVGWLTSFDSTGTLNSVSKQTIPDRKTVRTIVKIVKIILFRKEDIVLWISRSKIDASYYHPILALKGVMILSLLCLQASDCSQELLELLSGGKNIAQLLPNKFVANLLSRRKGSLLNLNPEVVSEAFLSIEDPLLIVCSGDVNSKINAPCAIFVDLTKSKEEIMSELFSTNTRVCVQNPSINDGSLRNGKRWAKEDMAFVFGALSELKTLSEALHKRPKKAEDHSVSEKTLQEVLKWLQSNTSKINDIMNRSAISQESMDGTMLVSGNSNTTEVEETSEKKINNEKKLKARK